MCMPKAPKVAPAAPAPTADNIGANEDVATNKEDERKRQRAAAGFQQNILSGSIGNSDANVSKKTLLG